MSSSIVLPYTTSPLGTHAVGQHTHSLYGPFHSSFILRPIRLAARFTVERRFMTQGPALPAIRLCAPALLFDLAPVGHRAHSSVAGPAVASRRSRGFRRRWRRRQRGGRGGGGDSGPSRRSFRPPA
jgi:hypothetical protein